MFDPNSDQALLFDIQDVEPWRREWNGMPEFDMKDLTSRKRLIVHFATLGDMQAFAELVEQKLTPKTQSIWFPPAEIGRYANKRYIQVEGVDGWHKCERCEGEGCELCGLEGWVQR